MTNPVNQSESQTFQEVVLALAYLAEIRDPSVGHHIVRTQEYVRVLALQLRQDPTFSTMLSDETVALFVGVAPLHDIGKIAIPEHILRKQDKLTDAEWDIMKEHASLGADAMAWATQCSGRTAAFLSTAQEMARSHHERWDGTGYPDQLTAEAIPLSARLMALADVFDALITKRPYKPPLSYHKAREIIVERRGTHFDPAVVDAFLTGFDALIQIAEHYQEEVS